MSSLKEIRELRGLTLGQLATEAQVNRGTLKDYESGKRNINRAASETVYRLSLILGCGMEDLLEINKLFDADRLQRIRKRTRWSKYNGDIEMPFRDE